MDALGAKRCGLDGLGRAPRLELAGGRVLRLGQTWKVATWEIAQLVKNTLGKLPLLKKAIGTVHLKNCIYI